MTVEESTARDSMTCQQSVNLTQATANKTESTSTKTKVAEITLLQKITTFYLEVPLTNVIKNIMIKAIKEPDNKITIVMINGD